jgi:hypothetical protein
VVTDRAVNEGDIVGVVGALGTENGERQLLAFDVAKVSSGNPLPGKLGTPQAALSSGLSNTGLLIRAWGRITQIGNGYLYINDGSMLKDGTLTGAEENIGIRVVCDPSGYEVGQYLLVNGVSSRFDTGSGIANRILIRRASDIQWQPEGVTATPVFNPDGGVYSQPQQVTITCGTEGAVIRYTTNGLDPTEDDPIIASGSSVLVSVDPPTTLKAKAWKSAWAESEVKTALYRMPVQDITIGTGTSSWNYPFSTYYEDARTQTIYLASEIGGAFRITALSLDVTTIPGQIMNNFTLRMKHTPLSVYQQALWESQDWTVVYQANEPRGETGWRRFDFTTPFDYNGVDNLMVDISFDNDSYTDDGECRYSTPGGNRSIYYRTDSDYGNPLNWSGSTPSASMGGNMPNIKLRVQQQSMEPLQVDITDVKEQADGTLVRVDGGIVSAVFSGFFYIGAEDRSTGIRVEKQSFSVAEGMAVTVTGWIRSLESGERYIEASSVE